MRDCNQIQNCINKYGKEYMRLSDVTELSEEIGKFLCKGYYHTTYIGCHIIPHTTILKHTHVHDVTLLQHTGWPKKSKPLSRIIIKSH